MKLIFEYEEEKITGHVPDADDFDNGSGSGRGGSERDHYDEEDRVDNGDQPDGRKQVEAERARVGK